MDLHRVVPLGRGFRTIHLYRPTAHPISKPRISTASKLTKPRSAQGYRAEARDPLELKARLRQRTVPVSWPATDSTSTSVTKPPPLAFRPTKRRPTGISGANWRGQQHSCRRWVFERNGHARVRQALGVGSAPALANGSSDRNRRPARNSWVADPVKDQPAKPAAGLLFQQLMTEPIAPRTNRSLEKRPCNRAEGRLTRNTDRWSARWDFPIGRVVQQRYPESRSHPPTQATASGPMLKHRRATCENVIVAKKAAGPRQLRQQARARGAT